MIAGVDASDEEKHTERTHGIALPGKAGCRRLGTHRLKEASFRMSERGAQSGDGETGACHVCSETFGTQEELAEHLRQQHEQDALGDVRPEPTPEASPQGETS